VTRAALYARVSTLEQAKDDRNSLQTQQAAFTKFCAERGYTPVAIYTDTESGRKATRPEYQKMLTAARKGEFDAIVVTFLDRFGREQWEIMGRLGELRSLGVSVEAVFEDTREFIMVALSAWKADQESKRIGERVKLNQAAAVVRGSHPGRTPYGYRRDEHHRLVVHEPEAEVVREVFRRYAKGDIGFKRIAADLNTRGIPIPRQTSRGVYGKWSAISIQSLISRGSRFTGKFTWGDAEGSSPAIITDEDDSAAQHARKRRQQAKGQTSTSDYLLTGIIFCAHCGGRMNGKQSVGRRKTRQDSVYRYYHCVARNKGKFCDYTNHHDTDEVEGRVLEMLAFYDEYAQHAVREQEDRRGELTVTIQAIDREAEEIATRFRQNLRAYHSGVFASDQQYAEANREIAREQESNQRRREAIEKELEDYRQADERRSHRASVVSTILTRSQEMSPQELKAALQSVIARVMLTADDSLPRVTFL
jgi:site-specific DNA recombinase